MEEIISRCIHEKSLVRVTTVKRKMGSSVILGRILEVDHERGNLLVYDDDRKQIHHLAFNEIDDICPVA